MNPFAILIIAELGFVVIPALLLFNLLRPRPLMHIFRGGEASVHLAFMVLIIAFALTALNLPEHLRLPIWILPVVPLAICLTSLLIAGRTIQVFRHRTRNKKQVKVVLQSLIEHGTTEEEIKEIINPSNQTRSTN